MPGTRIPFSDADTMSHPETGMPRNPASDLCEDPTGNAAALVRKMSQSDASALSELHRLWAPTLLGIAWRMLGDRPEAEETVQDVFLRMWNRAGDYDPAQSPPFVWAYGLLRGCCIDRIRFRHRAKRDSSRVVPIHLHPPKESSEAPKVLALDDCRRIREALDTLEPEERRCLELAVFLEYTQTEISESLTTPLGTVKHRLRRALDKVRKQLASHES